MKNLILSLLCGIMATGCVGVAGFKTEQSTKSSFLKDGVVIRIDEAKTSIHGHTFGDAKQDLTKLAASQTDKSQRVGLGAVTSESSATNATAYLHELNSLVGQLPRP